MEAVMTDYTQAKLEPGEREMLDFAVKLTLTPSEMSRDDVDGLRAAGFTDEQVFDVVQVTALFNYYDRLADGLGIEPEPEWS